MRVRIELVEVLCRDTEDVTGADTLYLVGGVSDGRQTQPVLTNRLWINNNQTRSFAADRSVMFDADVPENASVHIGLQAFDEDAAKDWEKHGEWVTQLTDAIAGEIEQLPREPQVPQSPGDSQDPDPNQVAAAILRGAVRVVGFFAQHDKDDKLGQTTIDIPVGVPGTEIKEWNFNGRALGGFLGWSTWNYTVRYRVTQLTPGTPGAIATYGNKVKLRHLATARTLHSHPLNYGHPRTSGQQQVTAYEGADDNDLWIVKGAHGQPDNHRAGQPVQNGDIIRLQHVLTGRNLHSHGGIPSPVTGQQEVTCFGDNGFGDDNDNWRVEIEGGGAWDTNRRMRLIHVNTNHALHSHFGFSHPNWTASQQEVTGFPARDDNDWWSLFEIH